MNSVKNKIRSSRGASITFALLLFLVCSIISIVVIVAGTAAAGRMSQIAATDQRYYAVTSAAGLLRDSVDGKHVTVTYEKSADPGNPSMSTPSAVSSTDNNQIVNRATEALVTVMANPSASSEVNLTPVFNLKSTAYSFLECEVKEYIKTDGRLIFVVSNKPAADAKDKSVYTLQISFNARISRSEADIKQKTGDETTIRTVVTTDVEWEFSGLRKGPLVEA